MLDACESYLNDPERCEAVFRVALAMPVSRPSRPSYAARSALWALKERIAWTTGEAELAASGAMDPMAHLTDGELARVANRRAFGEPIEPRLLRKVFEGICRTAGLPPIRFHDLRHSAATLLRRRSDRGGIEHAAA